MNHRADRRNEDGVLGRRRRIDARSRPLTNRLAEIVLDIFGRWIRVLQPRSGEIPMNVRVRPRLRVAAVLAAPTRARLGTGAEKALAEPERQPLFADPQWTLEQQRSRQGITANRLIEPASNAVVAVQWEERHLGKLRRSGPVRRVGDLRNAGTERDRLPGDPSRELPMEFGLKGRKVAILATDGVEQVELVEPRKALDAAGALTHLISPKSGSIQGMNHDEKGDMLPVDHTLEEATASEYDALLLPGGVKNPDTLRTDQKAVQFVRGFMLAEKPVAAICHGPWMLVEANAVWGRTLTSWPSLQTDIRNAGGEWVDEPVRVDDQLVTSRQPDDIPAFNAAMLEQFGGAMSASDRVDEYGQESFPASDPPPG